MRQNRSRTPASPNGGRRSVAENHSEDVAVGGYLATDDRDGGTAEERLREAEGGWQSGRDVVAAIRPVDEARTERASRASAPSRARSSSGMYAALDVC